MQRILFAAFSAFLLSCGAKKETADDIINKNIEARGGYDKVRSLKSVIFSGTYMGRRPLDLVVTYDHLKAMKMEYRGSGKVAYHIITTTNGWNFNPDTDTAAIPISPALVKDGVYMLDIQGLYVDYKDKGYKAEYLGKDTASGKSCFKIKLTKEGEGDKYLFFDENYLLTKTILYRLKFDRSMRQDETYYYDYRKNADGYLFSYRRASEGIQMIFDKVVTNSGLPAGLFEPH